jgi:SAM-dependent methyltransferase
MNINQQPYQKFNEDEVQYVYKKYVEKDKNYYNRCKNIKSFLSTEELAYWKNKDAPRVFSIIDYKEWIQTHNLQKGKNLLITSSDDPELKYINYENIKCIEYNGKNNDLHNFDESLKNFDLIIFNQTIEHLYNPFLCLKNLYEYLKPGGCLYTTVPTINIPHMVPFHYWGVTPIGLCMLSKSVGFDILECGFWGNKQYINFLFNNAGWPDYTQVCNFDNTIDNDPVCTAQTWVLVKKPL